MTESRSAFLDYRSPYVWQSRALNFNKQLIKRLNQVQKCNSKQTQPRSKKIGIAQHRNAGGFRHRLLEVSASPGPSSLSSSSSAESKEETPFIKSFYPKYHHHHHNASKMARNYMDNYNTSRATGHYGPPPPHSAAFSPPGGRCPVHGMAPHMSHHGYKHSSHYEPGAPRFSSATELPEYGLQPNHYLSLPYGYMYADKQYLAHYPHYYSSHMYMPSSYLPMSYLSPSLYTSKHMPPAYQPPPRRASRPYEYSGNHAASVRHSLDQTRPGRCKGHLVVLATILTVIIIGTVMGVILAVIN